MLKRGNKGFTLIELITVMVILGVLAAYAVPKLFNFTDTAKTKTRAQFRVEINSALRMYGLQQLASTGAKAYPDNGTGTLLASLLDDYSDELSDWSSVATESDTILYDADANGVYNDTNTDYFMTYDGSAGTSYTLGNWTVWPQ